MDQGPFLFDSDSGGTWYYFSLFCKAFSQHLFTTVSLPFRFNDLTLLSNISRLDQELLSSSKKSVASDSLHFEEDNDSCTF